MGTSLFLIAESLKKSLNIDVEDIAKRLLDYGFHAPTVSFPLAGTLMIEPTESESFSEMERFCCALISIRKELEKIENKEWNTTDNPIKNAPHPQYEVISENWEHPYSRETAVFPALGQKENKYWPQTARSDNAFGDRNLICTCPPIESYE